MIAGVLLTGLVISCGNPYIGGEEETPPDVMIPAPVDPAFWFKDIYDDLVSRGGDMGQAANCKYVCDAINAKWGTNIAPVPGTELQPANCEYLLKMLDIYVNQGASIYGFSEYATEQLVDNIAVDDALNRLYKPGSILMSSGYGRWHGSPSNQTLKSIDGKSWIAGVAPSASPASYIFRDAAFNGVIYVAIHYSSVIWSYDYINWHSAVTLDHVNQLAVCNGRFLAYYNTTNALNVNSTIGYYSDDGIHWYSVTIPAPSIPDRGSQKISAGKGRFVLSFFNDYYDNNEIYYSTDGINWTSGNLPVSSTWGSMDFVYDRFMIFSTNNSNAVMAYSIDGINWIRTSTPVPSSSLVNAVYGNGMYLVKNESAQTQYARSTNGGLVGLFTPSPFLLRVIT